MDLGKIASIWVQAGVACLFSAIIAFLIYINIVHKKHLVRSSCEESAGEEEQDGSMLKISVEQGRGNMKGKAVSPDDKVAPVEEVVVVAPGKVKDKVEAVEVEEKESAAVEDKAVVAAEGEEKEGAIESVEGEEEVKPDAVDDKAVSVKEVAAPVEVDKEEEDKEAAVRGEEEEKVVAVGEEKAVTSGGDRGRLPPPNVAVFSEYPLNICANHPD